MFKGRKRRHKWGGLGKRGQTEREREKKRILLKWMRERWLDRVQNMINGGFLFYAHGKALQWEIMKSLGKV